MLTADEFGSGAAFTADVDGSAGSQLSAGADAVGTIDGAVATGAGSLLLLPSGTSGAVGLALDTSGLTDADLAGGGDVGSVSYAPGLAQSLATLISSLTNSGTGALSTAQQTYQNEVKSLQDDIDAWDTRLADDRASLTTQSTGDGDGAGGAQERDGGAVGAQLEDPRARARPTPGRPEPSGRDRPETTGDPHTQDTPETTPRREGRDVLRSRPGPLREATP